MTSQVLRRHSIPPNPSFAFTATWVVCALIFLACSTPDNSHMASVASGDQTNVSSSWPPQPWPPQHCRDVPEAVRRLRNDQVVWSLSYVGVFPLVDGKEAEIIDRCPDEAKPLLVNALADPQRFVVAHVLLSYAYTHMRDTADSSWDHLTLGSDGSPVIDPNQQLQIQQMWRQRFGGT